MSTKAYTLLIERYRTWLFNLPDAKELLPMFELRIRPEEADFLSRFPFRPHTLQQLSQRLGISVDQLMATIEPLKRKGLIMEVEGKSGIRYSLTDPIFSFYRMPGWKGEDDEFNRKLSPKLNRYYIEHLGADFMGQNTKGLRALPIAGTLADTRTILPYEDVLNFIEQVDFHSVSTCACRHRHNLDPMFNICRHDTTNCLHFGKLGRYIVKHGMGKQIEKVEALEILKNAADAGLVHGISNHKQGMDTICNCCSCCCLFLEIIKIDPPNPRGHQRSNYVVSHNAITCKACGLCVQRCPMDALKIVESQTTYALKEERRQKKIISNPRKCMGCGVCVHKCPTQSLKLVRRSDRNEDIPENPSEAGKRLLMERGKVAEKSF